MQISRDMVRLAYLSKSRKLEDYRTIGHVGQLDGGFP